MQTDAGDLMNERIKELSNEAWKQVDVTNIRGRHKQYTRYFAELLIQECANYAFSDDQERNAMLRHFGVDK